MIPGISKIISQSVRFYKKPVIYQGLIIALLSAVITGSLLTGKSVRLSLEKTSSERLGNTGILISSGLRYFDTGLAVRLKEEPGINCTGLLEITGYCQNISSQKGVYNTHIYAIGHDFFSFHGTDSIEINTGEVAVNKRLADHLGLKIGDEIIIRFNEISEIPADAPFAPAKGNGTSIVKKIGAIIDPMHTGNFSLSISQIMPLNIFINLSDITELRGKDVKINRLLIDKRDDLSVNDINNRLKLTMRPSDIGISVRTIKETGETELVSERIFIDTGIINEVEAVLPSSEPVITYLANRITSGIRSTPYSFVAALPVSLYPEVPNDGIIINKWLAEDLAAEEGDTIEMFWYAPDSLNKLIEKNIRLIVTQIVEQQGIWSDILLMPDFPGISGSESCTDWDAGVPVKMDEIRRKDEDYWNKYKGTPKAFISYNTGNTIWGNNFGPATAIRFPVKVSESEVIDKLSGSIYPDKAGFRISDLSGESIKAANESVDFSTLFLSLGFFLILASFVLLSLAVASFIDSKKDQISTFFALGFTRRWIERLILMESGTIAFAGCLTGAFTGFLVNIMITKALNSVWRGAVQTDTLESFIMLTPVLTGFLITFPVTMIFMIFKVRRYLIKLNNRNREIRINNSSIINLLFLLASSLIFVLLFILSFINKEEEVSFSFAAGTMLLISLLLFWRQFYLLPATARDGKLPVRKNLSGLYFSFYPSNAVVPILFIAAGIFAVFITGANRMDFNDEHFKSSGGTGGYLLWCESTIALKDDLNSLQGKRAMGLDEGEAKGMRFVQAKRSAGDDASCLNLNHITAPPLLGIDPVRFISEGSFSFSKSLNEKTIGDPWQFLNIPSENNTIYGIADQTVIQWGLKIKMGDTLVLRDENGQPLNIIIAAGLKSSVFQGYVLIGLDNFIRHYPSVSGSSVLLVSGEPAKINIYRTILNERLENQGANIELTTERLASFYEVTNTYLSVFGVFGALGMIAGIAGLGFVLLRNYNQRRREFALMLATGFPVRRIRSMILGEQILILFAGVSTGVISAAIATLPSLRNSPEIPWLFLLLMISAIVLTGTGALLWSVIQVTNESLTTSLKRD